MVHAERIDTAALARAVELSGRPIDPFNLSASLTAAVKHQAGLAATGFVTRRCGTRLERPAEQRRVARSWQTIVGLPLFAMARP